jgi:hypothetical protein
MSLKKIKRNNQKRIKKDLENEVKEKLGMFDKLKEECLACKEKFDKTDRKMVESWSVVVRKDEDKVNLYCPTCWEFAQKVVKEVFNEQSSTKSNVLIEEQ